MAIEFDSAEYEYLTEAVQLSAGVDGLLVEIGLRKGWGTKTIIDAAIEHRPGSTVLSIDPFGSIPYEHREGQICRLDYTNDMYKEVLADMSAYVLGKNVNWIPWKMTDERFFNTQHDGVELYELEPLMCSKYAMVHLDGPHGVEAVRDEVIWFNSRMDSGSCIVIDDVTPDFIDIEPIKILFDWLGWAELKMGNKKCLWKKL